jgi:hypothetical protein
MNKFEDKKQCTRDFVFSYKTPWPGEVNPSLFKKLTRTIVEKYFVGDILSTRHRELVDEAIAWESVEVECGLEDIYLGQPIPKVVMTCFQNWYWRMQNGEEPAERNYEEEELLF